MDVKGDGCYNISIICGLQQPQEGAMHFACRFQKALNKFKRVSVFQEEQQKACCLKGKRSQELIRASILDNNVADEEKMPRGI